MTRHAVSIARTAALPPHRRCPGWHDPGRLPLPGLRPQPIQARLFSHALVENDLGRCADCGHQATKLLVGGAGQPDTSLCAACEYRRYLAATGGRDLANQERARWASHPSHALSLLVPALRPVTMVNSDR